MILFILNKIRIVSFYLYNGLYYPFIIGLLLGPARCIFAFLAAQLGLPWLVFILAILLIVISLLLRSGLENKSPAISIKGFCIPLFIILIIWLMNYYHFLGTNSALNASYLTALLDWEEINGKTVKFFYSFIVDGNMATAGGVSSKNIKLENNADKFIPSIFLMEGEGSGLPKRPIEGESPGPSKRVKSNSFEQRPNPTAPIAKDLTTFTGINVPSVDSDKTAWDVEAEIHLRTVEMRIVRGIGEILEELKNPNCTRLCDAIKDPNGHKFISYILRNKGNSLIKLQIGTYGGLNLVRNTVDLQNILENVRNDMNSQLISLHNKQLNLYLEDANYIKKRWLEAVLYQSTSRKSWPFNRCILNPIALSHIADIGLVGPGLDYNSDKSRTKIYEKVLELHNKVNW